MWAFFCPVDVRLGQIVPALGVGCPSRGGMQDGAHHQQLVLQHCYLKPKPPLTMVKAPACDPMPTEQLYLEDTSSSAPTHPHRHQSHTLTALCALLDSGKWLQSILKNRSLGYVSSTANSCFSLFRIA